MAISNVDVWQGTIDSLIKLIEEWGQPMELQDRDMQPPKFGEVDFSEQFTAKASFLGAIDTNTKGKTVFDGSSVEHSFTHIIYLEFIEGLTSEDWILYDNRRFDIITAEDVGELNGILTLKCNERGTADNPSNEA